MHLKSAAFTDMFHIRNHKGNYKRPGFKLYFEKKNKNLTLFGGSNNANNDLEK